MSTELYTKEKVLIGVDQTWSGIWFWDNFPTPPGKMGYFELWNALRVGWGDTAVLTT